MACLPCGAYVRTRTSLPHFLHPYNGASSSAGAPVCGSPQDWVTILESTGLGLVSFFLSRPPPFERILRPKYFGYVENPRTISPVSILRCGLCFRKQRKLLAIILLLADTFQYQSIDNTCFLKYCLHININYTLFTLLRYRLVSTCSNHVDSYR